MAAKEFCSLSGISTVRPTLENMEKTTSLSGPEQPSLKVTATLPFLTFTGVLGIVLTILRAGWAVTWNTETGIIIRNDTDTDTYFVDGQIEITEGDSRHDGHPELVRVSPPLIIQSGIKC